MGKMGKEVRMDNRTRRAYFSNILLMIVIALLLILTVPVQLSAQSEPPLNEDWVVKDSILIEDRMLVVSGNLIIESGGDLRLRNADLRMDCSSECEFAIIVEDGGNLELYDSSIQQYSGYTYVIIVEPAGEFNAYNSNITGFSTTEGSADDDMESVDTVAIMAIIVVIIIIVILLALAMKPKRTYDDDESRDAMVGQTGIVVKSVQANDFQGRVKIENKIWSARTDTGSAIRIGERVKVIDKENKLLTVERANK